jgi:hypothetical protein
MGWTEQAEGWTVAQEARGVTATRRYIYSSAGSGGELPNFGTKFSEGTAVSGVVVSNLQFLVLVKRDFRTIAGDVRALECVCSYSNEPIDAAIFSEGTEVKR